jgi:hypothetical protein
MLTLLVSGIALFQRHERPSTKMETKMDRVAMLITNGQQIEGESGSIAAKNKIPAGKFTIPPNFSDALVEDQPCDV